MSARKFRIPPAPLPPAGRVNTIIVPGAPKTVDRGLITDDSILWLTPQQLADIRIQYEIDEMMAGRRPAHRLSRPARSGAHRKGTPQHND